jgi:AcrR family transcriptional regulator
MGSDRNRLRRNDPQGMRRRVLDAAYGMFQANGYNGTSMQDVMKAAATSGGALHHHFPTKRSLALAVFRERVAPEVRETWIGPVRTAASLGEGVQSVFDDIAAGVETRGSVSGCPLNNLAVELTLVDREFREAATDIFLEWQEALAERVRDTRGGRKLSKAARRGVAEFIVASYSGAMALAKTRQSAEPLRHTAQILRRWLRSQNLDS